MRNERGAGRKPLIDNSEIESILIKLSQGDSVAQIAMEYGVSRQALYKRLKLYQESLPVDLDYMHDGECVYHITVNHHDNSVSINSQASRLCAYAFGLNMGPDWNSFSLFLENEYLKCLGTGQSFFDRNIVCLDMDKRTFSLSEVLDLSDSVILSNSNIGNAELVPRFEFTKKNLFIARTDTDGFQMKALSSDRQWFVKSQAVMSGIKMNDWAVEVIASDICKQLDIDCISQKPCEFIYASQNYKGVYSRNFELDGYSFISFESLLEHRGQSTFDDNFIHMNAIEKLEWCAQVLADCGGIPFEQTLKYMIDLALIDCLVGNVDRHTRNFGLFYDVSSGQYVLPLVFDNGMGLFEHDYYRDRYESYEKAMMNVYVSPYGEDPFDMIELLHDRYDLLKSYPGLSCIDFGEKTRTDIWNNLTENAHTYVKKIKEIINRWQKID